MPMHLLLPLRVTWLLFISWLLHIFPQWTPTKQRKHPKKHPPEGLFVLTAPVCSLLLGLQQDCGDKGKRWQRRTFLLFSYSCIHLPLAWQDLCSAFLQIEQHVSQLYSFLLLAAMRQNSVWKHFPVLKWKGKMVKIEYRLFCLFDF